MLLTAGLVTCTDVSPDREPAATNPYPTLATLKAEAAGSVVTPDATLIRDVSGERFANITGWQSAFYGHVYGTQQHVDEVFAYFQGELLRLGWVRTREPILSTGESDGWGWCKPRLFFRLAIFDPRDYADVGIPDGGTYHTVYDARLQGTTRECPSN